MKAEPRPASYYKSPLARRFRVMVGSIPDPVIDVNNATQRKPARAAIPQVVVEKRPYHWSRWEDWVEDNL